jgi:hypothetical protein
MGTPHQEHKLSLASVGTGPGKFRCCCLHCGSHVMAQGGFLPAGQCANCGSYHLGPLDPVRPVADAGDTGCDYTP